MTNNTSEIHAAKALRRAGFHLDHVQLSDIQCNLCGILNENNFRALFESCVDSEWPSFASSALMDSPGKVSVNGDDFISVPLAENPSSSLVDIRGVGDCILTWRCDLLLWLEWLSSSALLAMTWRLADVGY